MIGRLTGTIVHEDADGTVLLEVGGVAYELAVPLGAVGRARAVARADGAVTLHVHTHAREDALTLFAFATPEDKIVFRLLISVSNIGPKTALAVLSAIPADELARALASKDIAKLVSIPGIGRKTAERLVLELKDKLEIRDRASALGAGAALPSALEPTRVEVVARALTSMGYRPNEAERAVEQLRPRLQEISVPELIREALAILAR